MTLSNILRSGNTHIELQELLTKPPSVLLGVSKAAAGALAAIGIETVFDLGSSWLFANANAATRAPIAGTATARYGMAPTDWLQPTASWSSLEEIALLPLEQLRGIDGAQAATLKTALDVQTIRDFAFWPPQGVARNLVSEAMGASMDADEIQTERLRPRFGEFPTERVYYSTLVMLQMQFDGERTSLASPISLKSAFSQGAGFTKPAIGALLTISQSWYAQGITLGHMLHSLALAPGEATRIAVIDWSRRTRATTAETIAESEQLDNSTQHARALSEVQKAVADEFQQGGSASSSRSISSSASGQASVGTGFLTSLWASADVSGSNQTANTEASAHSSSWSLGNRSVTASMAQNVNDRTEQHASSVRNRRASAVREVAQSEHEEVSTRVVANYNHMHALTVQYYEVVQVYRVVAQVHRAERCLFLPLQFIDFSAADAMDYVARFRGALVGAALSNRARELLLDSATAVAIEPQSPVRVAAFRPELMKYVAMPTALKLAASSLTKDGAVVTTPTALAKAATLPTETTAVPAVMAQAPSLASVRVWDSTSIAAVSRYVARPILRPGSDALHLPDDTDLFALTFSGINVKRIQLDRVSQDAVDNTFDVPSDSARLDLPRAVRLIDLLRIFVAKSDEASRSGTMTLECAYLGRRFSTPPIPIDLASGTGLQTVVKFTNDEQDRQRELIAHLKANQAHYSQACFRALDSATIVSLLSQFDWNGRPLADQVEPKPLTVAGNYLVLRAPVENVESSGVRDGNNEEISWGELLVQRGIDFAESDPRLVPIPTSGVFAEAVLGRSNSAEKLDITRFWNWQESPIPLQPPEIAPVSTGSRATPEDLKPGNLSQPVLNIVNPTNLPNPTGVGAVLDAVANGNMFRDMSGLAGTQGLSRAAMEGTLQAASEAGQITSANLRTEAQKAVAMGQIAADLVKSLYGGGKDRGSSVQGVSGEGARINHGRSMDDRNVPTPANSTGSRGSASGNPGSGSTGSTGGAPGGGVGSGGGGSASSSGANKLGYSYEAAAFNQATHGIDPTTAANVTSATGPMLAFAMSDTDVDADGTGGAPHIQAPGISAAIANFKSTFSGNPKILTYGQFHINQLVREEMAKTVNNDLTAKPDAELQAIWSGMDITSKDLINKIKSRGIAADYPGIVKVYSPDPTATKNWAQGLYQQFWSGDTINASPSVIPATLARERAAYDLGGIDLNGHPTGEKGACHNSTHALGRKFIKAKGLAPIPANLKISQGQIAGAAIASGPGGLDRVVYSSSQALKKVVDAMKLALDGGYPVVCGLLSGVRHDMTTFPTPEHYILVFAYDNNVFAFWDSDVTVSNMTAMGWGPGFGILVATENTLSTGWDAADLNDVDGEGNHLHFPNRHRYQVYSVQTLPI